VSPDDSGTPLVRLCSEYLSDSGKGGKRILRSDDAARLADAKIVSLVVKFGALLFIVFLPLQYAIQLQLLGGIWISQTIPAVIVGLYTRWLNPWALIIGWAGGLVSGTWLVASLGSQSAVFPLVVDGFTIPGYAALYALGLNFAVSIVLSLLLNQIPATRGTDQTLAADYRF
jgi:SSS family solute:Na+ symporter